MATLHCKYQASALPELEELESDLNQDIIADLVFFRPPTRQAIGYCPRYRLQPDLICCHPCTTFR